jgi:hypothetical protein
MRSGIWSPYGSFSFVAACARFMSGVMCRWSRLNLGHGMVFICNAAILHSCGCPMLIEGPEPRQDLCQLFCNCNLYQVHNLTPIGLKVGMYNSSASRLSLNLSLFLILCCHHRSPPCSGQPDPVHRPQAQARPDLAAAALVTG